MKVKVNIEVWDNGVSEQEMEEYGVASKFIKKMYEDAFRIVLSEIGFDKNGLQYSCNVEVVEDES